MTTIGNIPLSSLVLDISNIDMDVDVNINLKPCKGVNDLAEILLESLPLPAYKLNMDEINWIQEFIKTSPQSFQKISKSLQGIIQDGKIDIYDIPRIIQLFADIYHSDSIKIGFPSKLNIITLVKFTLDVLLQSELIILPTIENMVVQSTVEASLYLLSMNLDNDVVIKKKWFCWC